MNQSNIPLVRDANTPGSVAGDRAPDAHGLWRQGVGFPLRMFDILKGTEHVLLAPVSETDTARTLADLSAWAQQLPARLQTRLRVVAITQESAADQPNIALYHDRDGAFAQAYGARSTSFPVRPDGYIGWRGASWRDDGLAAFISQIFQA